MALLSLHDISLSFGGAPLLDQVNVQIEPGERVCLVGRNGEGKSTLLKVIAGELPPDAGRISARPNLRSGRLGQQVPSGLAGTVYQVVAAGLGELRDLLTRHHELSCRLAEERGEELLAELAAVEEGLAASDGWSFQQRLAAVLSRLELDGDLDFAALSGGLKRRVLLARALVSEPDLLLLDEPTNHLDIAAITWLEEYLLASSHTLLFITHDRELLKKLATRVLDLDRGRLTSWPGDYATYLRRREEMLAAEAGHQAHFDRKLAEEETWIRQGIKARRTRNEGRVRALLEMRRQRQARREQLGRVRMEITEAGLSGKLVALLDQVSYRYEGEPVIRDLSTTVLRGDKIGIIGPNGAGKTTLLRLLLGELAPTGGTIRLGTNLEPAYFDQQRAQLEEGRTVAENLGQGSDFVEVNGRRKHVIGYLRDFLFTPDRARSPVHILSGGERNRLLLARLFAKPSNLLVLDEPTNDLDLETLELLEELLLDYSGTVLLVSHDRAFLNHVVTSSLVFEGEGVVREYAGGYDDWLLQRPEAFPADPGKSDKPTRETGREPARTKAARPRKLNYKENQELEKLPGRIEALEEEQQQLYRVMGEPAFYQTDGAAVAATQARLQKVEQELEQAYARWEELEGLREGM